VRLAIEDRCRAFPLPGINRRADIAGATPPARAGAVEDEDGGEEARLDGLANAVADAVAHATADETADAATQGAQPGPAGGRGGAAEMSACLTCASSLARSHRFCPQCGTAVPAETASSEAGAARPGVRRAQRTPMQTERKQVSVLFVDLCDSTEHVQGADPEEARAWLDQALGLMTQAVEAYGGTISQLLGDGLLALFGAPVAHEDHALRACLAAHAMHRGAAAHGRRGSSDVCDATRPFVFRVGIHSGEVIVGVAGQCLWSHYRADGRTIHLASRLEKLAAPGSTLLSAATHRLVAEQLDTRPVGTHSIRGIDAALQVFELVPGAEGSPAAPLARRLRWAPLVGREEALAMLDGLAAGASQGALRVVGLRGEAGIGKSRLIAEWCARPALAGFAVCTALARGYSSASAYSAIADIARELLRLVPPGAADEGPARHRAALDGLLATTQTDAAWLTLSPGVRRRWLVEALDALIRRCLAERPLLLVLEDVFLADRESQRLLESLMPRLDGLPVLVCVSYRQDFEHRWADAGWFTEHWLAPLHQAEMLRIARSMLGEHATVQGVADELVDRADGNPFFLEQLVITLIDDGSLVGTPGDYRLTLEQADLRAPGSIAAVICARVDRLPAAAKSALEAAAVLAEPIRCELIAHMQQAEPDATAQSLKLAEASGLLTARPQQHDFVFRHALVQEVLLGTLTRPRRKALHRRSFAALRQHHGQADAEAAPTLARHAFAGEEWELAAQYAVKSIARAVSLSANREALRLFELGLDASRRVADPPRALALELALLLEAIAALMALGQVDRMFANLERANAVAAQIDDPRSRATVALQISVLLWMRGRYLEGLVHTDEAFEAGRRAGRRNLQMAASQTRMMLLHGLGRYREAAEAALRVHHDFDAELRQRRLMAGWATVPVVNLLAFQASALSRLGEQAAAQRACDEGYRVLAKIDHPYSRSLLDFSQSQLWLEIDRCDAAVELLRDSVDLCVQRDVPTMLPCCLAMLGGALAQAGRAEEALGVLEPALAAKLYLDGGVYGEVLMRMFQGAALRRLGRSREAIDAGEQALALTSRSEQLGHRADALLALGETLAAAGEVERARSCLDEARAQAQACEMPGCLRRATQALETLTLPVAP